MQKYQKRMLALGLGLNAALAAPSWADTVRQVELASNDIVFDARTNAIYASVPGSAGTRGNTLTPIDPTTAALGTSVFVGSEPKKLAISGSGEYLYVGLDGAASVRRFDLASQTAGLLFSLGSDSFLGSFYVDDMEVMPGSPGTVAISLRNKGYSPRHEGVAIFDEGVKRPTETPGHTGSNVIEFSSPTTLYGYNNETTEFGLRKMSVESGGVSTVSTKSNLISGFGVDIRYDNGLIYSTNGAVVDPEAGMLLGTFPDIGFNGNVRPDSAAGRVFFVTGRDSSLTLKAYDMRTFTLVGSLPIPGAKGAASSLIRWGSDGLAFRTDGKVYIVQSSLVGAPATPGSLSLSLNAASISEAAGAAATTGTLTRTGSTASALTVQLASSNTSEASVPASVTIPAGASSVTFAIAAVDDAVADGSQAVSISASAAGFSGAVASLTVTDDETAALVLTLAPSTWSEGAGAASIGTVTRNTAATSELVVRLTSSNSSLANVPQSVVIPAGQRSATFAIATTDDAIVNGNRTVTITASADGVPAVDVIAIVTDNDVEPLQLSLSLNAASISEAAGATTGTLTRTGSTASALTVQLASSNTSEAIVPASVTIPAGVSSVTFAISAVDDAVADGSKAVFISASAAGFGGAAASLTVTDDETAALVLTLAPSTWSEGAGANASVGTVTRNTPTAGGLVVRLASSNPSLANVPQFVVIPAGQRSATFAIATTDDAIVNGSRTTTITASADGFPLVGAVASITDNDVAPQQLTLSISPSVIDENAGSIPGRAQVRGRVIRSKVTASALVVKLSSSDLSELRVPQVVVIPANQTSVEFTLVPVDDLVADGAQAVTITAQAAGHESRSATVTVRDNEVAALSVLVAPARIVENGAATVIVRRNTQVSAGTAPLTVLLSASPSGQVSLPTSVTIPAGSTSVAVRVVGTDDVLADGPRLVTILARASGLASGQAPLTILDNEAASNLSIGGRVLGQAPGSLGRLALPGVLLTLKSGATTLDTALTSSSGAYIFRGLPRGQYQIIASKAGAIFSASPRIVPLNSSLSSVDFTATLAPKISGTIVKRALNGTLSAAANTVVTARSGRLSFSARTNSAGAYVMERLPLGVYTVSVAPSNGVSTAPARTVRLDAASPQLAGLDFTLNTVAPRANPSIPAS